jgi:predicted alpha/beta superfamily hydrolase
VVNTTDTAMTEDTASRDTNADTADADADSDTNADSDSDLDTDTDTDTGTMVLVHYDTGFGNAITLRGEGDGLSWTAGVPCTWTDDNVWVCGPLPLTATAAVKPLVNDTDWALGYNWIVAPGETVSIYPAFYTDTGRVEVIGGFHSTVLGNSRDIAVYLPPSYDENPAKHYPVLFMHDGQNLFEPALSAFGVAWEVDETLDHLSTWGGIHEVIVVAPYNNADRIWEYAPSYDASVGDGGGADGYLDFLLDEVAPWVEANYRSDGSRPGIAGSSLGGLLSLHACWTRPSEFSRCGVFSPSLWWEGGALLSNIQASTAPPADVHYYLDSGDSGPSSDGMTQTIALRDALAENGWVEGDDLLYVLGVAHAHNEAAWAARVPGALAFLFADARRTEP